MQTSLHAYVETNPIDHLRRREQGCTEDVERCLTKAIAERRLLLPASVIASEEILRTAARDPEAGYALGTLQLGLVSFDHVVKLPGVLLRESIEDYLSGVPRRSPFFRLEEEHRAAWRALATGSAAPADVEEVLQQARADSLRFRTFMTESWDAGQAAANRFEAEHGRRPRFEDVWPGLSLHYAEGFAERAGLGNECRAKGIEGLLGQREMLAAVGSTLALITSQAFDGRSPEAGDGGDLQHAVMAAAAGNILVTHDVPFSERLRLIPGLGLNVLTLPGLAALL